MLLFQIISLAIKHIAISTCGYLYLYIKLNVFFKFHSLSYSLNCDRAVFEEKVFFQHL